MYKLVVMIGGKNNTKTIDPYICRMLWNPYSFFYRVLIEMLSDC